MPQKPQVIIENYDSEERAVEGVMIDAAGKTKRFREKGYNVEEFKKQVRKKFGDGVDIVNKVKKHREAVFGQSLTGAGERPGKEDERFSSKDIREAMKNKFSD